MDKQTRNRPAEPFYRRNIYDHNSIDNDIDGVRSLFYVGWTDDTADVIFFLINFKRRSL
ncbi:hypothetical protein D515_03717 [Grimontia indica]|uniref:Uncharacterized protein n=1 Tax=Grimontia indica TaxID=1056512 RepID=R1GN50_9GAMM|nr:hypothetical protein [Grimontia indica]EOD77593.1 hypothetical protein D515_03717 [Grimontia indica]